MNHPITKTFLALGCAGTLAATASAQLPTTYTAGDFLLGFREIGSTNSVVVDIGPIASFSLPLVFTINAGSTLTTQYGSGWASNANVFSSLVSTDSGDKTSYVTSPEYLSGPAAGPAVNWDRLGTTTNANKFQGEVNAFGAEFTSAGGVQPSTDINAYANYMPGGTNDAGHANGNISWGFFNPDSEGDFSQTTTGVALALIQLPVGNGTGTDEGNFQISSDGNTLTFTPDVVPEPSTYAAIALGTLALLGFQLNRARKSSTKEQSA